MAEGSAVRACLLGGNANNGANAGLAYVNSNNAPGNANVNVGSRLRYTGKRNNFIRHDPASRQKTTI